MIIIFSIFLALLLWGIIQTTSLTLIIKEVRKANWKEWINIIVGFLKKRATLLWQQRLLFPVLYLNF